MSTTLRESGRGRGEVERFVGEPPEPDDELLTLFQVAELLYAHPETVNQWLPRGWLRGVRVDDGKRGWRIWASDFRRFRRELEQREGRRL
jgi:excisionase family DNA binding protein